MVEENPNVYEPVKDAGNKIYLFISDETIILKQDDDTSLSQATNSELKTGIKVKGWINGPILQSYPGQAGAARIVILQ